MSSPPPLLQSPPEPPKVFGAPTFQTDGELLAVGIASDGTLWTVEEPGELRGWNLSNRRQIVARPLDSMATLWTFNWAARLLASASEEVEIWEVSSGTLLASWSTSSWVNAIMFQPGTTLLATGHDDGRLCIWDWATQKLLREIQAHNKAISAVAFHPDRVRIATAGEDKLIHIWDATTGDKRGTLKGHKDRIPALAWHPDERRLFSAGWDTTVRVWDCETFKPIILLNSHSTQVHCLGVTADGRLLASADSNRNLYLWDTQRYQTVSTLQQQGGEIRCMAFTPDDGRGNTTISLLAYGGTDRLVHLWDTRHNMDAGGRDPMLYRTGVAVSPDGHSLFSHSGGSDIRVWDIPSGLASLSVDPLMVRCMALSPDASTLAISSGEVVNGEDRSGKIALFSVASGQKVTDLVGPGDPVTLLAFRPDGSQLASASVRTPDVWLWNLSTGKPELILNDAVENCSVEALAFHPKGSHLAVAGIDWMATGGRDGSLVIWDLHKKAVSHQLRVEILSRERVPHIVEVGGSALAFSPDGKTLAVGSLRRTIFLWDWAKDRIVHALAGHEDIITCLAFHPSGRYLASAGDDRSLRLWDTRGGEQLGAWEMDNPVKALAFSPDGQWLFTGNANTSCYQIEVDRIVEG